MLPPFTRLSADRKRKAERSAKHVICVGESIERSRIDRKGRFLIKNIVDAERQRQAFDRRA
jgi:hypothetical protein